MVLNELQDLLKPEQLRLQVNDLNLKNIHIVIFLPVVQKYEKYH